MRTFIVVAGVLVLAAGGIGACMATRAAPPAQVQEQGPAGSEVRLCGPEEPGERLVFGGRVLDYDGRPLGRAAVVAYHTDSRGLYNPRESRTRVPRLRAVAITGDDGRFRFATVRPGTYADRSEPAHVHVAVLAPAHHPRYVDYWFEGDPLITERRRSESARNPGIAIVRPTKASDGAWTFTHDIRLEGN